MPRTPDTPCAGCGKLLYGGKGALPAGQRRCQACRRARTERQGARQCQNCGGGFVSRVARQKYCSRVCSNRRLGDLEQGLCSDCGEVGTYPRNRPVRRCTSCAAIRRRESLRAKCRRRHRGIPEPSRRTTLAELGERAGWLCHLCGEPVDEALRYPDQMSASVDHLEPVVRGGNDEPENLDLAHWICNVRRGARLLAVA